MHAGREPIMRRCASLHARFSRHVTYGSHCRKWTFACCWTNNNGVDIERVWCLMICTSRVRINSIAFRNKQHEVTRTIGNGFHWIFIRRRFSIDIRISEREVFKTWERAMKWEVLKLIWRKLSWWQLERVRTQGYIGKMINKMKTCWKVASDECS